MTRLVLAFMCGMLLCGMRAPLGTDLLAFPAVSAGEAYAARALALVAVAVIVLLARRSLDGRSNGDLLLGATLGYLTEGLLGELHREACVTGSGCDLLTPVRVDLPGEIDAPGAAGHHQPILATGSARPAS